MQSGFIPTLNYSPAMRFHTRGFFLPLLFLLASPAASQAPPPGPDPNNLASFNPSMGVIIIVLIAALFFMGIFSIYIRHCSDDADTSTGARITGFRTGLSRRGPRGLDPAVIESFPTFDYSAVKSLKIGKGALECAICINEFEEDETLRLIPKCDHVFHPDCIDAWLISHTTCPVCRADLLPRAGESVHAPLELHQINETDAHRVDIDCDGEVETQNDDVSVDVVAQSPEVSESMEQPLNSGLPPPTPSKLNRNRTRRNVSERPRWFGKFSRSNSTGHMAVKQWENLDRFTLRLPEDVRKQIISGKLSRTTSCVALPMEASSRRGNRTGFGEGSSRGRRFGSGQLDRAVRSDRWVFSLTPPFFSREPSFKSPRMTAAPSFGGSAHSCKAADSVHRTAGSEAKLPPV